MANKKKEKKQLFTIDVYFDNPNDIFEPRVEFRKVDFKNMDDDTFKHLRIDYDMFKSGEGILESYTGEDLLDIKKLRDKFIRDYENYELKRQKK